jgi:hypothetical protein
MMTGKSIPLVVSSPGGNKKDEILENMPWMIAESNIANLNKGSPTTLSITIDPNRMSERRGRRGSAPLPNMC